MRMLPVAALVLASLPAFAAPSGELVAVPSAQSRAGRFLAIEAARARAVYLVGQSKKERPELLIDVFRAYTPEQIRDRPKGGVTLEMLLEVVKADAVPKETRQRAAETIYLDRVIPNDPALSLEGRKEKRKRAEFSLKVNKLLLDNDPFVRGLAQKILEGLWGGWGSRMKEIKACDPRDRNSCVEANKAWLTVFKT